MLARGTRPYRNNRIAATARTNRIVLLASISWRLWTEIVSQPVPSGTSGKVSLCDGRSFITKWLLARSEHPVTMELSSNRTAGVAQNSPDLWVGRRRERAAD